MDQLLRDDSRPPAFPSSVSIAPPSAIRIAVSGDLVIQCHPPFKTKNSPPLSLASAISFPIASAVHRGFGVALACKSALKESLLKGTGSRVALLTSSVHFRSDTYTFKLLSLSPAAASARRRLMATSASSSSSTASSSSSSDPPPRVLLVGIGGPTCSGKTTLAKHLVAFINSLSSPDASLTPTTAAAAIASSSSSPTIPSLTPTAAAAIASSSSSQTIPPLTSFIIHQDDFAPPESSLNWNEEVGSADWDDPDTSVDWVRMRTAVDHVKRTGSLPDEHRSHDELNVLPEMPVKPEIIEQCKALLREALQGLSEQRGKGAAPSTSPPPTHIVLLDGFILYYDSHVRSTIDVPLFLRIGKGLLRERRETRGGYVTADGDCWKDPPRYFDGILWPSHLKAHAPLFQDGDVEKGHLVQIDTETEDGKKSITAIEAQDPAGEGQPRAMDEIVLEGCKTLCRALREWRA